MNRIEFGEYRATPETFQLVHDCLVKNRITMGDKVKELESLWKNLFDYKYARLLSSGTAADTAACMALYEFGAHQGNEIICPALTFIASANAIRAAGFYPVFVDVDPENLGIDYTKIEDAITRKTVAIMAVNLMGRPAQLDVIQDIAKRHNLKVIVDNCECYGGKLHGKLSLEYGDIETSSHYIAHLIMAAEGGMVSTNDPEIDRVIQAIRSHGRLGDSIYFDHPIFGLNFKPTDIHAAIGIPELRSFYNTFRKRTDNMMQMYHACYEHTDKAYFIHPDPTRVLCPHAFSVTLKHAGKIELLQKTLDNANIAWKRNFGSIPTQHGAFRQYGHKLGDFPHSEWIGDNGLHIGVHKFLNQKDVDRVCDTLDGFFRSSY